MTRAATQAEREVFAATAVLAEYRALILKGGLDDHPIMQAIQAFGDQRAAEERAKVVEWLRAENSMCDCFARSESECACGAWDDYKTKPLCNIADAIERGEHSPLT